MRFFTSALSGKIATNCQDTSGNYSHITSWAGSFHKSRVIEPPPQPKPMAKPLPKLQEPGFNIVLKSITADQLKTTFFSSPSPGVLEQFESLNPGLGEAKAGSKIVLSDPNKLSMHSSGSVTRHSRSPDQ
ncbi:hypothetical protein [Pseudomonas pergaminensis]